MRRYVDASNKGDAATLASLYADDAMLRALETEFADWPEVRWTKPAGGLYVWLTFPPHVNAGRG